MLTLVALLPVLTLIVLLLVFRRGIILSSISALVVLLLASIYWGTNAPVLGAASLRGVFLALEITAVLIGAIVIFEILETKGISAVARQKIQLISKDYRIQALIVGIGVVCFMEGVAGFGTPAILAVPLLMALGFRPIFAVVITLISDSIPVSFGAIGLPITFGIGSVIETITTNPTELLSSVTTTVAALNIIGFFILGITIVLTAIKMHKGTVHDLLAIIPFIALSSLIVSVTSFFTAIFIGAELPSIIGGAVGVLLIAFLAKKRFLLPKNDTNYQLSHVENYTHKHSGNYSLLKLLIPYIIIVSILLATRLSFFNIGDRLQDLSISLSNIFGSGIDYSIAPLYSVSGILLITAAVSLLIFKVKSTQLKIISKNTFSILKRPFIAILLMLVFVQIFMLSGQDNSNDSMPIVIAESLSNITGKGWIFVAPFIGALGSFLAGSATISNLVFSGLQFDTATLIETQPSTILALQSVGAALGNMVAIHNIVAALAIAKLSEKNVHKVVRYNLKPLFILLVIMSIAGYTITIISS